MIADLLFFCSPQGFDRSPLVFFGDLKLLILELSIFIGNTKLLSETPRFSLETPSFSSHTQYCRWRHQVFNRRLPWGLRWDGRRGLR